MNTKTRFCRVAVIMAGGSGERFWPVSRSDRPKQFLRLTDSKETMLSEAVARIAPLIPLERVYIATGEHLAEAIRAEQTGVPDENVLAEPCKRNTAGCLAFATARILADLGEETSVSVAVVTADHLIGKPERFRETVSLSLTTAEEDEVLVTHGIAPDRPETGYGYIEAIESGPPLREEKGISVYPVAAFHEKPNKSTAEELISKGNCYWNSGMFFWRVDTFIAELDKTRPDYAEAIREMAAAMRSKDKGSVDAIFEDLENISIDYALIERSEKVAVVRADYPWDDVGSWTSLDRTHAHDEMGNVKIGNPVVVDCRDTIVYNEPGAESLSLSVVGMENVIVVATKDGVLVIPKDRAQDVKLAVKELRARGADHV